MPKGKHHPEMYLALHAGLTPKDLIARGFKPFVVYNYSRKYNQTVKKAFEDLIKMPVIVEPKEE